MELSQLIELLQDTLDFQIAVDGTGAAPVSNVGVELHPFEEDDEEDQDQK